MQTTTSPSKDDIMKEIDRLKSKLRMKLSNREFADWSSKEEILVTDGGNIVGSSLCHVG